MVNSLIVNRNIAAWGFTMKPFPPTYSGILVDKKLIIPNYAVLRCHGYCRELVDINVLRGPLKQVRYGTSSSIAATRHGPINLDMPQTL